MSAAYVIFERSQHEEGKKRGKMGNALTRCDCFKTFFFSLSCICFDWFLTGIRVSFFHFSFYLCWNSHTFFLMWIFLNIELFQLYSNFVLNLGTTATFTSSFVYFYFSYALDWTRDFLFSQKPSCCILHLKFFFLTFAIPAKKKRGGGEAGFWDFLLFSRVKIWK